METTSPDPSTQGQLLATHRLESGVQLHALPMSSLSFKMGNEAICVAMGLCLGVPLCQSHACQLYGASVDSLGTHGLHCSKSLGRHPYHTAINNVIKRSLASAKIAAHLEPVGICWADGKRLDDVIIMPLQSGCVLIWDVTCPDTFTPFHQQLAVKEAGAVAGQAERWKVGKYAELAVMHNFVPVVVETTWSLWARSTHFPFGTWPMYQRTVNCRATTYSKGSQWLSRGAVLLQCWAHPQLEDT